MAETRVGAAIDAIKTALDTVNGLTVWDGPIVSGDYSDAVYIGYDADPDGDFQAADIGQVWVGVGATRTRDEEIDITCAAVALVGEAETWKTPRDTVLALVESVGQKLRADTSLGLSPPCRAELTSGGYFQEPGSAGWQARLVFNVRVTTRV